MTVHDDGKSCWRKTWRPMKIATATSASVTTSAASREISRPYTWTVVVPRRFRSRAPHADVVRSSTIANATMARPPASAKPTFRLLRPSSTT